MNIVYALAAYPAGVLSDRMSRKGLLAVGLLLLAFADLALALVPTLAGVAIGVVMGVAHGLHPRPVCNLGGRRRAAQPASTATFLAGAGFTLLAFLGLTTMRGVIITEAA